MGKWDWLWYFLGLQVLFAILIYLPRLLGKEKEWNESANNAIKYPFKQASKIWFTFADKFPKIANVIIGIFIIACILFWFWLGSQDQSYRPPPEHPYDF